MRVSRCCPSPAAINARGRVPTADPSSNASNPPPPQPLGLRLARSSDTVKNAYQIYSHTHALHLLLFAYVNGITYDYCKGYCGSLYFSVWSLGELTRVRVALVGSGHGLKTSE